ncbi:hypothetical protein [Streptomyces sp. NPDC048565]|uniref:hypothetical protein n=1 Tax=Streptomyces sp. NPDC048565 TaxID=3155266 RepID=UPI003431105E
MTTQNPPATRTHGDDSYNIWLRHTVMCSSCRAGFPCVTAERLGRAWRQARR